jgi:hypothetical protein
MKVTEVVFIFLAGFLGVFLTRVLLKTIGISVIIFFKKIFQFLKGLLKQN